MVRRILIVVFLFILVYGFRLNYPQYPYFDEVHFVSAGQAIAQLSGYPEKTHPPLGKILIALSIRIFGDTPWAWRLVSLILAGFATAFTGYLAFLLTRNVRLFWLASLLLTCDGLWITQARIGLVNAPMVFFILAALILWWHGQVNSLKRQQFWIMSGICAGLAMACKWQGALVVFIPFLFYLCSSQNDQLPSSKHRLWIYGLLAAIVAYFSTFLIIPFIHNKHWIDILKLQAIIPNFHLHLQEVTHRDTSLWCTWPFLIRPVWYGFLGHESQIVDAILCVGNPFIFMLIFPALVWILISFARNRTALSIFVLIGVFIFWIPSGIINRYTLFHHFYPVMPFLAIAIASMLDGMWQSQRNGLKVLATFLLVLIISGQIFFYPIWTGLSISKSYFNMHIWLPSWL